MENYIIVKFPITINVNCTFVLIERLTQHENDNKCEIIMSHIFEQPCEQLSTFLL